MLDGKARKVWGEAENITKSKNKNRQKSEKELKHKFAQTDKPAVRGSAQCICIYTSLYIETKTPDHLYQL